MVSGEFEMRAFKDQVAWPVAFFLASAGGIAELCCVRSGQPGKECPHLMRRYREATWALAVMTSAHPSFQDCNF
jgi:hypothetical protein